MRTLSRPLVLLMVLGAGVAALLPSLSSAKETAVFLSKEERHAKRLLDPKHVSERTKTLIRHKMKNHGHDVEALAISIALLDYEATRRRAEEIAQQPRVDRSVAPANELQEAFFTLQDELRVHARTLAEAAARHEAEATAKAFGQVVSTCAGCHAAYLNRPTAAQAATEAKTR